MMLNIVHKNFPFILYICYFHFALAAANWSNRSKEFVTSLRSNLFLAFRLLSSYSTQVNYYILLQLSVLLEIFIKL